MTDTEKFRFCVAPMLDWTDRHCRYFMRLMTKRARLYTEMVTTPAIIHGNRDLLLKFDSSEHPVACQLGGSDPEELAEASRIDHSKGVTGYTYSPHVLGLSLRHEVRYRSIGFNVGFGWYLHRRLGELGEKMAKPYYETIGLRYYIPSAPLYVSYHVVAHLLRADAMQFNLGITL